jgi:hypothetical protein
MAPFMYNGTLTLIIRESGAKCFASLQVTFCNTAPYRIKISRFHTQMKCERSGFVLHVAVVLLMSLQSCGVCCLVPVLLLQLEHD